MKKMSERTFFIATFSVMAVLGTLEVLFANWQFAFGATCGLTFALVLSHVDRNYVIKESPKGRE